MGDARINHLLHPKSVKEALAWWDSGRSLFTIEMGGLGPGYEQSLQLAMIGILRKLVNKRLPKDMKQLQGLLDKSVPRGMGLSGAQAGAAQSLAYAFLTQSWETTLGQVSTDRRIQISKHWPKEAV